MKKTIAILLAIAACITFPACHSGHNHEGEDHEHSESEMEHHHEGEAHADEIIFDEHKQERFGIETSEVRKQAFSSIIRTGGEILPASGDEITLSATTSGVFHFKGKLLSEGSYVAKNALIAVINTQSVDGGDPVSKAKAALETAEKEYLRDTELLKDNIISLSHYEQSKLEYSQAKSAYEALTRNGYGDSGLSVSSPMSGYIKTIYVSEGQYVNTGEVLAVVSQNRRLQIRAELSEKYSSAAKDIVTANIVTPEGKTVCLEDHNGRLLSYGRNASDHFIPVSFELDNNSDLIPGSYVEIYLKTRKSEDCIAVPLEAIVESQGVYSVFVKIEPDAFVKKDVELGMSDGVNVQILSGLDEGDELVTKGAMQIKLASVSAVPSGHNHSH